MTASRQAFRNLTTKAPRIFGDEVSLRYSDGIALITMCGVEGELPWGTKREEHRWNPPLVRALNLALDATEQEGEASAVVVANEGRFWSNGFDLKFVDAHNPTTVAEHGVKLADLMARILCFPLPTIAAFSGHWCAAGGMMGLTFDYRVMATDRGFFFHPWSRPWPRLFPWSDGLDGRKVTTEHAQRSYPLQHSQVDWRGTLSERCRRRWRPRGRSHWQGLAARSGDAA